MIAAAHHSMIAGKKQPYDPIYGVRSDGVAYCSLGNINASSGRYDVLFDLTTTSYSNQAHVFGGHGGTTQGSYLLWHLNKRGDSGFYCENVGWSNGNRVFFDKKDNHIVIGGNNLGVTRLYNGVEQTMNQWTFSAQRNNACFLIFRANANSTNISPQTNVSVSIVIIRALKVWFGDEQVADLIPCKIKSNNEVGFWNVLTDEFVGNIAGSGSLIEVAAS